MIQHISIQNYALIERLALPFSSGLTTITGETGSGKSIIIGALGLILGDRADTQALKDKTKKCVVEGTFDVSTYRVKPFFKKYDLDYDNTTVIRREINAAGKSRAFINDTPVNLNQLKELTVQLVDLHSQHQTLHLGQSLYQLNVIDTLAGHEKLVAAYRNDYKAYTALCGRLEELEEQERKSKLDLDYFQFQYDELEKAALKSGEQAQIEGELNTLHHAEEIKTTLQQVANTLGNDGGGALAALQEAKQLLGKVGSYNNELGELEQRIQSTFIELQDIEAELNRIDGNVEHDPQKLEHYNDRLNTIYSLQQKHQVQTVEELVGVLQSLEQRISNIGSIEEEIAVLKQQHDALHAALMVQAQQITKQRTAAAPLIEQQVKATLQQLSMPEAILKVQVESNNELNNNGLDLVSFSFTANKGGALKDLAKVASGGELSRLMLAIKASIASKKTLPTIIFDEIDTGVSGDVADKIGGIMLQMAENMQVFSITHLPQIASKGHVHFKVFKDSDDTTTITHVQQLNHVDRVNEIAKMLSGEELSEAAIENAKVLLGN